jgi:hypothetical protein
VQRPGVAGRRTVSFFNRVELIRFFEPQVERQVKWVEARGEFVVERFLAKYDQPDIPEQFLVVRT